MMFKMNEIKFMYNGIKINGKLIKGFYSYGKNTFRNGAIAAFYAKSYYCPELREIFKNTQNDSDLMEDYHETDKIYFFENDKNLKFVKEAWKKQEIKLINRAKWSEKEKQERIERILEE